jgi:hypothetical protein
MSRIRDIASILTTASNLATDTETAAAITAHNAATTSVHGITNTASLATQQFVQDNKGIPSGNGTQRPSSFLSSNGDAFVNTTTGYLEIYNSTYGWESVGKIPSAPTVSVTNNPIARAYNNGSLIADLGLGTGRSYTITTTPATSTSTTSTPYVVLTGLQSNTSYTVTATSTNLYGTSTAATSSPVTVTTVPQAPVIYDAIPGDSKVRLVFTTNNGGSSITSYQITVRVNNTVVNTVLFPTNITEGDFEVTGLTNGTGYTFIMTATNANGTSVQSLSTNGVYPISVSTPSIDYLVVAGGGSGGGGSSGAGGAGGAGGYRTGTGISVSAGVTYTVTVGAGASTVGVSSSGGKGSNSSISGSGLSTITSTGGGIGGYVNADAGNGGSGGGGGGNGSTSFGTGNEGGYNPAEGNNGGTQFTGTYNWGGGGGGGAGGAGQNATTNTPGDGGAGINNSITGSSIGYAGGGGGGAWNSGAGGGTASHGGGSGGKGLSNGSSGTSNRGGGGGGGGQDRSGGLGGSGVVIIRYPAEYVAATTTGSPTVTTSGGYRIYQFNNNGTIIV